MATQIKFDSATLGETLTNRKNLQVPLNQRSYAWLKGNVLDLLRDLNGSITKGNPDYFLGAVIVLPTHSKVAIYDGQQRLATTSIVIAAIRDFFFQTDRVTADTTANEFLRSIDRRTHELKPHLTLNVDDNQFYVDRVLRNPDEPERVAARPDPQKVSHKLISDAAVTAKQYFQSLTSTLPAADSALLLHKWLDYLVTGARVIWVEVGDEQTAYRVFETMNDRGLKLSAADLLKNFLYATAGGRKDEMIQRWQAMSTTLESLGRDDGDVVDFIRYYWITTHGQTRLNDLFDDVKDSVTNESLAINFVTSLDDRSNDYAAILTPSHERWTGYHQEIRALISTIRYLGVSQLRPLLLSATGKFSQPELEKLFKLSVNWSVRFLVAGVPSGTLEGYYARSAKKVTDGIITNVTELGSDLAEILPTDETFQAAFARISVATSSLSRYYLRRLQIEKDGIAEPQYTPNDGAAVTLEHILPKSPGAGWSQIDPEIARAIYNRLGNQALLAGSVNSGIGNIAFSEKLPAFTASPFSLTSEVAQKAQWTLDEINERQDELARLAISAWSLRI